MASVEKGDPDTEASPDLQASMNLPLAFAAGFLGSRLLSQGGL